MQVYTQAAAILAILCMSAPALASMVNAIPIAIPEAVGVEARDPSWLSSAADTIEDVAHAGNAVGDVMNAGDSIVNAGKGFFNDAFNKNPTPTPAQ